MPWIPIIPKATAQRTPSHNSDDSSQITASEQATRDSRISNVKSANRNNSKYFPWASSSLTRTVACGLQSEDQTENEDAVSPEPTTSSCIKSSSSTFKVVAPKSLAITSKKGSSQGKCNDSRKKPPERSDIVEIDVSEESEIADMHSVLKATETASQRLEAPFQSIRRYDTLVDEHSMNLIEEVKRSKENHLMSLGKFSLDVVGISFYKSAASQARTQGAPVYLVREPGNKYDAMAIRAMLQADSGQIGHVPRSVAQWLSPLLDSGLIILEAVLTESSTAKSRIPKKIPLIVEVFDKSNYYVPDSLQSAMVQLNAALGLNETSLTQLASKRARIDGSKETTNNNAVTRSFPTHAHTSGYSNLSTESALTAKSKTEQAQTHCTNQGEETAIIKLPFPTITLRLPPSLDLSGLLGKAVPKSVSQTFYLQSYDDETWGFSSLNESSNDFEDEDLHLILDEYIEDSQAIFDMSMLDDLRSEHQEYNEKIRVCSAECIARRQTAEFQLRLRKTATEERIKKSQGVSTICLEFMKSCGVRMTADDAIDQGLLLPSIDDSLMELFF